MSLKFPFEDKLEFLEHKMHAGAVTALALSFDDQILFSCGEDGVVMSYRITEKSQTIGTGLENERVLSYLDEVLVTRSDMDESSLLANELFNRIEELKLEGEYQVDRKSVV